MNQLIKYLLENLMLDFEGDLSLDMVRGFLKDDDSREAKELLNKLVENQGTEDMMITVADCLREHLGTGIDENVVRDQLQTFAAS